MTVVIIEALALFSLGGKLLSVLVHLRFRDAVDKVSREERCAFRKGRGCVDKEML